MAARQLKKLRRMRQKVLGDSSRVITRLHIPGHHDRARRIIERIMGLSEMEAAHTLEDVLDEFSDRHKDISRIFERHYREVHGFVPEGTQLTVIKRNLIGAYFTMEYSIESAALFNPSIIPHPNQDNVAPGGLRFILSLRATGEGHISSIVFRSGVIEGQKSILFDAISPFVETPEIKTDSLYDRHLFQLKLNEMEACNEVTTRVINQLPEEFTHREFEQVIATLYEGQVCPGMQQEETIALMFWLADSNYEINFDPGHRIAERVIFPISGNESRGIEDARFVRFQDNGATIYYATYTAYNGFKILPQLIETRDFVSFKISTLNGAAVQNKGMALFPRKIGGKFVMLSRQDGENNHLMFSESLHFWHTSQIIQTPTNPWEFVQIGNCGSPLETEAGWLVLTHGVGPMRKYCIGALLLDLDDPTRVIGRLDEPLLTPQEIEREGYVPNVVYSCGALIHNDLLIIPYAMSDMVSAIATVNLSDVLGSMH